MTAPVLVAAESGEALWFGGGLVKLQVTSAQSDGALALLRDRMPRGKATPLHLHPDFDETLWLISGSILVHVDGAEYPVDPGGTVFVPRGVAHAFLVTSHEAELLAIATPGNVFEQFLRAASQPATDRTAAPPPLDIERVRAAGERTGGMRVLGPPPFAR